MTRLHKTPLAAVLLLLLLLAPMRVGAAEEVPPQPKQKNDTIKPYDYEGQGRPDPFVSLIVKTAGPDADTDKCRNPLLCSDITQFNLIAIVSDEQTQEHFALVILPDGKNYTLRKGMKIGMRGGTIDEITLEGMIVTEITKDFRGNKQLNKTPIKLRKEEEK